MDFNLQSLYDKIIMHYWRKYIFSMHYGSCLVFSSDLNKHHSNEFDKEATLNTL